MRFFYLALLLLTSKLPLTESCDQNCSYPTELLDISFGCVNNSFGTIEWHLKDYDDRGIYTDGVSIKMKCFENKTLAYELLVGDGNAKDKQSRSIQYSPTISSGTSCSIIGCVSTRDTSCRVAATTVCTYTPTSSVVGSELTVTSNEITDYFTMTTTLDHSSTALVSSTGESYYSLFSSIKETSGQQITTHNTSHPSSTSSIITQSSISQSSITQSSISQSSITQSSVSQSSFQSLNSQSSHTQSPEPPQSISDPPIDTALLTVIIGSVLIPVIGIIVCCIIVFVYIIVWRNSKRITHNEPQDFSRIFEMELYKLDDISLGSVVTVFQPLQNCTLLSEKTNSINNKDTESIDSNNVKEFFSSIKTDSTLKALESNKPADINNYELPQESNKLAKSTNSNGHNSSLMPVRTAPVTASSCDTSGYVTVAHMLNTQPHNIESEFVDTSSDSMEYNNNGFSDQRNRTSSGIKFDSSAVSDYVHM